MLNKMALAVTLALIGSAPAYAYKPLRSTSPEVRLSVQDKETGAVLPFYFKNGQTYVPGEPGRTYDLLVHNTSSERVKVVLSVDGVNVITGETAASSQTGYIVNPHSRTVVKGWRKSESEIAEFYFTPLSDSYAAKTGRPGNVGVIGAAVFREKLRNAPEVGVENFPYYGPDSRIRLLRQKAEAPSGAEGAQPAPASSEDTAHPLSPEAAQLKDGIVAQKSDSAPRLGTGHGDRKYDSARYVNFTPQEGGPVKIISVRYDSRANLARQGILMPVPKPRQEPRPFPAEGFVPDPVN
jgi:hypothetical protein